MLTSTTAFNEIRRTLTNYLKNYVYPNTDRVECNFDYEWSIEKGNSEEEEAAEVPAAAAEKPAAEAPKQQKAPAAPAKEDPFAAWERANAKVEAHKPRLVKQQPAAKPDADASTRRMEKIPAAAPAKPAAKPASKPVVEEEFSLDDILNEFR